MRLQETEIMNEILLTGFCGTSSELVVKMADCKSLILPNDICECFHTDFAYDRLQDSFEAENLTVRISNHAGTSFCNALYWNVLEYIQSQGLKTKVIFLHIPFRKNITVAEDFCKGY